QRLDRDDAGGPARPGQLRARPGGQREAVRGHRPLLAVVAARALQAVRLAQRVVPAARAPTPLGWPAPAARPRGPPSPSPPTAPIAWSAIRCCCATCCGRSTTPR